jgi:hypothetical protein
MSPFKQNRISAALTVRVGKGVGVGVAAVGVAAGVAVVRKPSVHHLLPPIVTFRLSFTEPCEACAQG